MGIPSLYASRLCKAVRPVHVLERLFLQLQTSTCAHSTFAATLVPDTVTEEHELLPMPRQTGISLMNVGE